MSLTRVLIFLGPPGSGKGTVATECIQHTNVQQISTGNVCRRHMAAGTDLGKQLAEKVNAGQLVPDAIIGEMLAQELNEAEGNTIILDGFPRTRAQAEMLQNLLEKSKKEFSLEIVEFTIPQELLVDRIIYRAVCTNKKCQTPYSLKKGSSLEPKKSMVCDLCGSALQKRSDDTKETIVKRIAEYEKHKSAIINFYDTIKIPVVTLNAQQEISNVLSDLKKKLL